MGIAGILLFSTKAIFVKLIYAYGADAITALALRMVFSIPVFTAIALSSKNPVAHKITVKEYLWLICFGFVGYYLASLFDFLGLVYIKASLERLILFIYPTLVILISYLVFGEKIQRPQALGLVTTYVGIVIVFLPEVRIQEDQNVILGGLLVFLSALTYGSYIVGSGWLIPRFGVRQFTSMAMLISGFAVICHYLIQKGGPGPIFDLPSMVYVYAVGMAVFSTVLPSYFISYAIRGLGANQFSIFGSLGPVSTIVLAYIFLGERLTILQLTGGIVVILGVFVAERYRNSGLRKVGP